MHISVERSKVTFEKVHRPKPSFEIGKVCGVTKSTVKFYISTKIMRGDMISLGP